MSRLEISSEPVTLPLPAGPGVEKTLPPALEQVLFGECDTIFAVLDAGRIDGLRERLAALGVAHHSLFSERMTEEAGDSAPWLVAFDAKNPLLYRMLCDVEGDHAGVHGVLRRGAGILLRSELEIAVLRQHLRRFMRVKDAHERNFFFRFWEPEAAAVYFRTVAERSETVVRWMCPHGAPAGIDAFFFPVWLDGPELLCAVPVDLPDPPPPPRGRFALTEEEVEAFGALQWRRDRQALAERLAQTFPHKAKAAGDDLRPIVHETVDACVGAGFWRRDMLFTFCAWALHFGVDFIARDPKGEVARLMALPLSVEERFELITERMDTLERDHFALPGSLG
ncbi:DUF4123 domain-containing protein [Sulfitobacter albidus]|uniref:DUF4123 domain-containing protein n=1 Tax=Sulfitobacter albidus TaxID=2829501 RepID=A0A975JH64_9RHOB|nr:DUF4123 domain-containing protein [Sulfitobacter albidus]QUJ78131.1 DUF4123 domain-containing protein [Sulfitobacter albidus]